MVRGMSKQQMRERKKESGIAGVGVRVGRWHGGHYCVIEEVELRSTIHPYSFQEKCVRNFPSYAMVEDTPCAGLHLLPRLILTLSSSLGREVRLNAPHPQRMNTFVRL